MVECSIGSLGWVVMVLHIEWAGYCGIWQCCHLLCPHDKLQDQVLYLHNGARHPLGVMTKITNHDWCSNIKTSEFYAPIMLLILSSLSCCYKFSAVWLEKVELGSKLALQKQLSWWGIGGGMGSSLIRKSDNYWLRGKPSFSLACIVHLNVWMKCSARPFDDGWYGTLRICLILFYLKNRVNLSEDRYVKQVDQEGQNKKIVSIVL